MFLLLTLLCSDKGFSKKALKPEYCLLVHLFNFKMCKQFKNIFLLQFCVCKMPREFTTHDERIIKTRGKVIFTGKHFRTMFPLEED